jgi:hypothetical protein
LAAAPIVPAAYLQYYLLAWPMTAVAVARFLPVWWRRRPRLTALLCLAAFAVGWTPLQPIGRQYAYLTLDQSAAAFFAIGCIVGAIGWRLGRRRWLPTFAVLVAVVPGAGRTAIQYTHWNLGARQREEIAEFHRRWPGPALDGFTGLGCLSPHAGYWWWINHHSTPLLRKEGAIAGVVELVWRRVPAVVVFDENLQQFGNGLTEALERGYDLERFAGRYIWIRRDTR